MALTVLNLEKSYGKKKILKGINLTVNAGEIVLLLGENGAGKTTTISCILGLENCKGSISISGFPHKSIDARKKIGYIPEIPELYDLLTVRNHLEFIAQAYHLSNWETYYHNLIATFHLADQENELSKNLSKGMKQKLNICCALLPEPDVLILDEPFVGLDPVAIKTLKETLKHLREQGCTIFVSTHMIDMVTDLWDRAYILSDGFIKSELCHTTCDNMQLESELIYKG